MKSKAYAKHRKLPDAPKPTLPVRVDDKPTVNVIITKEQRKRAVEARNKTRKGIWSYEEERNLIKLCKRGLTRTEIAEYFPKRTLASVNSKIRKLKSRGQI